MTDGYETESFGGSDYPAPGRWSLNWACGQVVSWYYGDDKRDTLYAHFFDTPNGRYIEVGDERFDLDDVDRKLLNSHIVKHLRENVPYIP